MRSQHSPPNAVLHVRFSPERSNLFESHWSNQWLTNVQLFIQDLGHDEPTILLTNQRLLSAKKLITRYAQRMLIENALSDAVRFFHIDALSSSVGLKIDFDMGSISRRQRSVPDTRQKDARLF